MQDEDQVALLEAENGLRQFDEVLRIAGSSFTSRSLNLTPELICHLNMMAVLGIRRSAGKFRTVEIQITNTDHEPPPASDVPQHVKNMCGYVNEHWNSTGDDLYDALHLSAYVMWRLNWIHPFRDGNGRTSRAVSYLVLTVRLGQLLAGKPTIADQIVDNKTPYYVALDRADAAWKQGRLDVSAMQELIGRLLEIQLSAE